MPLIYYTAAIPLFALLGLFSHISRGLFNLFPDRGYGSGAREDYSMLDDFLSSNYSVMDHLVGTEYDDNGYYDLYSLRNLRIACIFSVGGGVLALMLVPDLGAVFAAGVDFALVWFRDLVIYRLQNIRLY